MDEKIAQPKMPAYAYRVSWVLAGQYGCLGAGTRVLSAGEKEAGTRQKKLHKEKLGRKMSQGRLHHTIDKECKLKGFGLKGCMMRDTEF